MSVFNPGRVLIDPSGLLHSESENYERGVYKVLGRISESQTGLALLISIQTRSAAGGSVRILPDTRPADFCNEVTRRGYCMGSGGQICVNVRGQVTITFTTPKWLPIGPSCERGQFGEGVSGFDATEVLIHELTHALRLLAGTHRYEQSVLYYTNGEEFFAILLTNIYSSEVGRRLRNTHTGFPDPDFDVNNPNVDEYLRLNRTLIEALDREHRDLCDQLQNINTRFNPIRRLRQGR